jgi:glucose-6-phosphate 1-dehydrogenase
MAPGAKSEAQAVELTFSKERNLDDVTAYERVLGDALVGDSTLFARQDYMEEAWRIVDPVLKAGTPIHTYEPNTWGPMEFEKDVTPPGGWHNLTLQA